MVLSGWVPRAVGAGACTQTCTEQTPSARNSSLSVSPPPPTLWCLQTHARTARQRSWYCSNPFCHDWSAPVLKLLCPKPSHHPFRTHSVHMALVKGVYKVLCQQRSCSKSLQWFMGHVHFPERSYPSAQCMSNTSS